MIDAGVAIQVEDNQDGQYRISYTIFRAAEYFVRVSGAKEFELVGGGLMPLTVVPGLIHPAATKLHCPRIEGLGEEGLLAGEAGYVRIQAYDNYGNRAKLSNGNVVASLRSVSHEGDTELLRNLFSQRPATADASDECGAAYTTSGSAGGARAGAGVRARASLGQSLVHLPPINH